MRWESPENKFPKKTYGAYLLRKSANKTNWEEAREKTNWVFSPTRRWASGWKTGVDCCVPPAPTGGATLSTALWSHSPAGRQAKSTGTFLGGEVSCLLGKKWASIHGWYGREARMAQGKASSLTSTCSTALNQLGMGSFSNPSRKRESEKLTLRSMFRGEKGF